jgi:poly(A) polymerase
MNFADKLNHKIFSIASAVAEEMQIRAFVVGGFVRDLILGRRTNDIDIMCVGSGIEFAKKINESIGKKGKVEVYSAFGTAMLRFNDEKIEFAGARKESYNRDSRNPIVEDGTLEEDLSRRDFTINAMAISLNKEDFGELIDNFNGYEDLREGLLITPLDPDITFSDDPLRMFRAVRFSAQLFFDLDLETIDAIKRNAYRIEILKQERITEEFNKILVSEHPSAGINLLDELDLLKPFLPELIALKGIERIGIHGHKDNFYHTLEVLEHIVEYTQDWDNERKLWLRWAALMHDIAKPRCKKYDPVIGWTFHNHETVGSKMVEKIFKRLMLPENEKMKYVKKLVSLHLRPIALVEEEVTDSAVRRLLFEAGDDIDDLMLLCRADITSKNPEKIKQYNKNFDIVLKKMAEIEEKDRVRNFKLPLDGNEIMEIFNLPPSRQVGEIREAVKNAVLDGIIPNDHDAAYNFVMENFGETLR